jgi:hypothetical protein
MNIDYKKYTLAELYDVRDNIDQDMYPERYQTLLAELKFREENDIEEAELTESYKSDKSILGIVLLILLSFYSLWTLITAFIDGSIKWKRIEYSLAKQPEGFYILVALHIVFFIAFVYGLVIIHRRKSET